MRDVSYHANVGIMRPGGSSSIDRKAGAQFVCQDDDEMNDIEDNLNRITLYILVISMDDLPRRYQ